MGDRSCGVIMDPFLRSLADRSDLPPIQIIGGNGSAALLAEDTVIDLDAGTIDASAECDLPRHRPDGSLRDMDTLVLSSDPEQIAKVQGLAEETVGDELKISIFGLKTLEALEAQASRPVHSTARVFLGDRYVAAAYDAEGALAAATGFKALYPFRAAITAETLDTFRLSTEGRTITPTAHPGATILNYLTRSISGARSKDITKLGIISNNVLSKHPAVTEWIHDGPGRETFQLARVLHTLREPGNNPQTLQVGDHLRIVPLRLADLDRHESFMASHLSIRNRQALIQLAHTKARVLRAYEGNPTLVTFWQNHVEDRLRRIVHND